MLKIYILGIKIYVNLVNPENGVNCAFDDFTITINVQPELVWPKTIVNVLFL